MGSDMGTLGNLLGFSLAYWQLLQVWQTVVQPSYQSTKESNAHEPEQPNQATREMQGASARTVRKKRGRKGEFTA